MVELNERVKMRQEREIAYPILASAYGTFSALLHC